MFIMSSNITSDDIEMQDSVNAPESDVTIKLAITLFWCQVEVFCKSSLVLDGIFCEYLPTTLEDSRGMVIGNRIKER